MLVQARLESLEPRAARVMIAPTAAPTPSLELTWRQTCSLEIWVMITTKLLRHLLQTFAVRVPKQQRHFFRPLATLPDVLSITNAFSKTSLNMFTLVRTIFILKD